MISVIPIIVSVSKLQQYQYQFLYHYPDLSDTDNNTWSQFRQPDPVPQTPDAWQLFQDGRSVYDDFPEGYSPRVDPIYRNQIPKGLSSF